MPSLRCVVSALTQTQAGGGDLFFRFASSVQSCCGEGGALQADVAVCGEHWPCSGRAARGLALSPRARLAPSLCGPSARHRSGLSKSLDRSRVGGGGFSGAEFAPCPPPPTSSGDGPALLWSFSVPLFCEPPTVCSGRSILPSLSHSLKNLPPTALRAFWPVPTLSNAARSSVSPPLAGGGCGVWGTFLLGVAFRHVICGPYLIFPPS